MKALIFLLLFAMSACGNPTTKKNPQGNQNNDNADVGLNNGDDTGGGLCGNGTIDNGETCDGNCPASCDDGDACTVDVQDGDGCTIACNNVPVGCNNDDGCCPPQCTFETDNDCSATCGDGVVDDGETCDGNCPADCSLADSCFVGELKGAAANCTAFCDAEEITGCVDGDGCCPANCTQNVDDDCSASCGNDIIEDGETCDGDCPTSCDDNNACTTNRLTGSVANCSAACSFPAINTCTNGDGCCPANCDWQNDNDCPCTPQSCAQQGIACGQATNGCGQPLNCGGCNANESCVNNQCVVNGNGPIGAPCIDGGDCASQACATEANDWRQGYCTDGCRSDNDCPNGSHCGILDSNGDGLCLDTCASDTQCRADGYLCYDVDDDNASECFPAGTGAGAVGTSCNGSWECGGGEQGWCILGWPNGYCTRSCGVLNFCPSGASCGIIGIGTDGICHESCTVDANCRSGYTCEPLLGISGNGCVGP